MELLLAVAVIAVLGIGSFGVSRYLRHRRVTELTAWARANGWTYKGHADQMADRFVGIPFGRGFGRTARHLLTTTMGGRPVVAFEYSYKERVGSGKDARTVTFTFTVTATTLPVARPSLQVIPVHPGTRPPAAGLEDLRLEDLRLENEEFNRVFKVSTDDREFAHDVLCPRTVEWILADPRARELDLRFERSDVLAWEHGRFNPQRTAWAATYLLDLVDRVPQFVWK
jgi:hypothetical protein